MPAWLAPLLPSIISGAASIFGGVIGRGQSRRDIREQNEYNSPKNQLARLREAGLPMGAMGNNIANTQSSIPQTSGESIQAAGGHLTNYITTQTQLKQIEIMKADAKLKNAEADRAQAETKYLLEGQGEDTQGTNLTRSLKARIGLEEATTTGTQIANEIAEGEKSNQKTRQGLENTETIARIAKLLQDRERTFVQMEGDKLNNKILEITSKYQDEKERTGLRATNKQIQKWGEEIGLIKSQTEGKNIENDINALRYQIEQATEQSQIDKINWEAMMRDVTYKQYEASFKSYQQYQEFVDEARKLFQDRGDNFIPTVLAKRLLAQAYTAITGVTGNAPGGVPLTKELLNGVKD